MGRKRITPVVVWSEALEVGQKYSEAKGEGTTRIKLRGEKKGDDGEDKFSCVPEVWREVVRVAQGPARSCSPWHHSKRRS